MLPMIDLHCDTLYEATKNGKSLIKNDLHLSFERLCEYPRFCQVMAVWSASSLDCEGAWENFFKARKLLAEELKRTEKVRQIFSADDIDNAENDGVGGVILAVEGGKLIGRDLSRLDILHNAGVRFITLTWDDPCNICGSNKTGGGLTDFGKDVLLRMFSLGIIPDVSHASDEAIEDTVSFAEAHGRVCIATHSNSRAVCDHSRNLTDRLFLRIIKAGGVVGISMAPQHLSPSGKADISDIVRHIEHYMSLGGEDSVCLGCDLDGIERRPDGINNVNSITKIADALGRINYTDSIIKKIFYANARNFISEWIK